MKTSDLKSTAVLMLIAIVSAFQACTSDTRVTQARERVEQQIKTDSKGLIKLKTLDKVNGQETSILGSKMYELDFKVIIEYQDDCYKVVDRWGGLFSNYFTVVKNPEQERNAFSYYSPANYQQYKKGTKEELTGVAYYEMKEKGWFLNDLSLKNSKLLN